MEKYVGILGGGQLALMLCESGKKLNYKTLVLDPDINGCSKNSANIYLNTDYENEVALEYLGERASVITYEFENVPRNTIGILEKYRANVPQGYRPLYISQNRLREKNAVKELGIKVPQFKSITSKEELLKGMREIKGPWILKSLTGGYDGKGQKIIETEMDGNTLEINGEFILEEKIALKKEISLMIIRGVNGDIVTFPIGENLHRNGILYKSIVPGRVSEGIKREVLTMGRKIIEELNFYGPLGIEFFIDENDEIYFNEMAPRPHNTIHYSIDACDYSQFDLILKGLMGENIENPKLLSPVVMINILGEDKERYLKLKDKENWKIKLYGKTPWKNGRKMGHINILGNSVEEIEEEIKKYWEE
ncbi:5-(carboxyamino)imidazole ribonucleotide synthase [Cetobacterium ceti]